MLLSQFFLPELRPNRVHRPRLLERLAGTNCQLVIITAPAGFGKTTLASEWVRSAKLRVSWLSLDEGDNDPARFWSSFVTCIDSLYPGVGETGHRILATKQSAPVCVLLTALLNDIIAREENDPDRRDACLVLDDTHRVNNRFIYEGLLYFVEHLPKNLLLALVGRSDPPMPLGRLRANCRVLEIRAADLRFSLEESEEFFNRVMDFRLSSECVKRLEQRTEGWIAGLQLAGLAMQALPNAQPSDLDAFVASFSGNDRYVLDYLVEEVLNCLPEETRAFLLQTAILDRMCGRLCDAVTGAEPGESQAVLERLERDNLFLIPLDNHRLWYRYHHLFADLLRHQLERQGQEPVEAQRRKAAEWLAGQGYLPEAIDQALQAHDFERAAQWIECSATSALERGEYPTVEAWIEALPHGILYARPDLLMQYVWTLNYSGKVTKYERPLAAVERLWREQGNLVRLGEALNLRADFTAALGDSAGAGKLARQALDLVPEDQSYHRGMSWMYVGAAAMLQGDMEEAQQALGRADVLCRRSGNTAALRLTTLNLAQVCKAQGKLPEAGRLLEEIISQPGSLHTYEGLAAELVLGTIWREWGQLDQAEGALRSALATVETTGQVIYLSRFYLDLALLLRQKGDEAGVEGALQRHARLAAQMSDAAEQKRGDALRAQLAVLSGDLKKAQAWRESNNLQVEDAVRYPDEDILLALARLLIRLPATNGEPPIQLLEKLQSCAEAQKRVASLIEIWMLKALALYRMSDPVGAVQALETSLALAQPGGYRRLYLDEGQPLSDLLDLLLHKPALSPELRAYAMQLRTLATSGENGRPNDHARAAHLRLIEPLTPRETEVLHMIQAGLSNREIAERLCVTLNTVKVHAKNIYGKLDVASRTQAVRRAEELGLIQLPTRYENN